MRPAGRTTTRREGGAAGRQPGEPPLRLWGRHAVEAALVNRDRPVSRLRATANAASRLSAAALARVPVEPTEVRVLDALVPPDAVHQGFVLDVGPLPDRDLQDHLPPEPNPALVLVLDQVEDPRNVGAILRSAAAFGVAAMVMPRHGGAFLGGVAARAASGALDTVPICEVGNLSQALDKLKGAGFWLAGLDGEATTDLRHWAPPPRVALVLGAEGRGLRRLTAERCDLLLKIGIAQAIESLNVSVAAGIALHALSHGPATLPARSAGGTGRAGA